MTPMNLIILLVSSFIASSSMLCGVAIASGEMDTAIDKNIEKYRYKAFPFGDPEASEKELIDMDLSTPGKGFSILQR
jgi:hypothetical protein